MPGGWVNGFPLMIPCTVPEACVLYRILLLLLLLRWLAWKPPRGVSDAESTAGGMAAGKDAEGV